MEYNITDICFSNNLFWAYYFSTSYPNAYCKSLDVMIDGIVQDIYNIDLNQEMDWINNFTGYYEGVMDESDGYLEHPNFLKIDINPSMYLTIEFHPGDTLYYINNINIGCTGPHWMLFCLTWTELKKMIKNAPNGDALFWLLLPIVGITKEDNIDEVRKVILEKAGVFQPIISSELLEIFIETIISALIMEECFYEVNNVGIICNNPNSFRSLTDSESELIEFNRLMSTKLQ